MATDGDKIAAATLAAKLIEIVSAAPNDEGKITKAIELYGDVLRQIVGINPDTGKPFTHDEIQRRRTLSKP